MSTEVAEAAASKPQHAKPSRIRRINPILLFVVFNIIVFVFRDYLFPGYFNGQFTADLERTLNGFGVLGYVGVVAIYVLCSFFFVPILIPLNVGTGAMYGAYVGTAVSWIGITLGCFASTISVRYVFKGLQSTVGKLPVAQRVLAQIGRHGGLMVIVIRLAFAVPYLFQNIVLAMTSLGAYRLTALTAIGALPCAAIYSFLGAGLLRASDAAEHAMYLAIPLLLLLAVTLARKYLNRKYEAR